MKQCPDCKRVYKDDSFDFCLDDGMELVYGPAEPPTAIISSKEEAIGNDVIRHFDSPASAIIPAVTPQNFFSRISLLWLLIGIIVIGALAFAGYWYFRGRPAKQINSLAVMPFSNDSGTPDAEYLSDGITDTLINSLSKIPGLNVKARSSVFRYKGQNAEPVSLGKELSVKAVLIGRVVQRGDGLSIYLSLVDTDTGDQIWGEDYDRKLSDIVAVQKEIT